MSNNLFSIHFSLPKQNTAFLYSILESLEGLVFYSTLEHLIGDLNREMNVTGTNSAWVDFKPIFEELSEMLQIQVISSTCI